MNYEYYPCDCSPTGECPKACMDCANCQPLCYSDECIGFDVEPEEYGDLELFVPGMCYSAAGLYGERLTIVVLSSSIDHVITYVDKDNPTKIMSDSSEFDDTEDEYGIMHITEMLHAWSYQDFDCYYQANNVGAACKLFDIGDKVTVDDVPCTITGITLEADDYQYECTCATGEKNYLHACEGIEAVDTEKLFNNIRNN